MRVLLFAYLLASILELLVYVLNEEVEELPCHWGVKCICELHLNSIINRTCTRRAVFNWPCAFQPVKYCGTCRYWSYPPFLTNLANLYRDQRVSVINLTFVTKVDEVESDSGARYKLAYLLVIALFRLGSCFLVDFAFCHPGQELWIWVYILNHSKEVVCVERQVCCRLEANWLTEASSGKSDH